MANKRPKSNVRKRQAQIAVRLLPDENEQVLRIADRDGTSRAEVIRRALQDYLTAGVSA